MDPKEPKAGTRDGPEEQHPNAESMSKTADDNSGGVISNDQTQQGSHVLCIFSSCLVLSCLGFIWLGLAWLGLAWLGLAWLGLAWLVFQVQWVPDMWYAYPVEQRCSCTWIPHLPRNLHYMTSCSQWKLTDETRFSFQYPMYNWAPSMMCNLHVFVVSVCYQDCRTYTQILIAYCRICSAVQVICDNPHWTGRHVARSTWNSPCWMMSWLMWGRLYWVQLNVSRRMPVRKCRT